MMVRTIHLIMSMLCSGIMNVDGQMENMKDGKAKRES